MAGTIQIPRLADGEPEQGAAAAPIGGESVPHPGLLPEPDFGGIISAIRSGYAQASAAADDVHARADLRNDTARNALIATGAQIVGNGLDAIGKAQRIQQEKSDSLYALRVEAQHRQDLDLALGNAAQIENPKDYLGATSAIRAEMLKRTGALGDNENQKFLIQRAITQYDLVAEHEANTTYFKKVQSTDLANANTTLDLALHQGINTDDPAKIGLALQTARDVVAGNQVVTADKTLRVGGLGGYADPEKQREVAKKWETDFTKGRLERELLLRPQEFLASGYKQYQAGGMFPGTDPVLLAEFQQKAQAQVRAEESAARANVEYASKMATVEAKKDADAIVSNFVVRFALPDESQRPTYQEVSAVLLNPRVSQQIDSGLKEKLIQESMNPFNEGGVTDPRVYQRVQWQIMTGQTKDVQSIYMTPGLSLSDSAKLGKEWDARQGDNDPVAKRWEYKLGSKILNVRLGSKVLDPLGLRLASDEDTKLYTDTLTEYDKWSHAPGQDLSKAEDYATDLVQRVLGSRPQFGAPATTKPGGGAGGPGAVNFTLPSWIKYLLGKP